MVPLSPDIRAPPLSAVGHTLRAVAFWVAVALPVTIIAVLAMGGGVRLAGVLSACNAVALVLGHGHRSTRERRPNHDR